MATANLTFAPSPRALTATAFDNHGSLWGHPTLAEAQQDIDEARAEGTTLHEWDTTDQGGQPVRIVRIPDPTFLDTILVIPAVQA